MAVRMPTGLAESVAQGFADRNWRYWTAAGAAVALALLAFVSLLGGDTPQRYEIEHVTRDRFVILVGAAGQLRPSNQVRVGAEVSGLIREVLVDFNDEVAEGDVLARIDADELTASVVQAEATLAAALATYDAAQVTAREVRGQRDRIEALHEQSNASNATLEIQQAAYARARAAVTRAEAGVIQSEAALSSAQSRLNEAEIRSPIDGIVLDRLVEPGQTVASSFQAPHLFTIAQDLSEMELIVDVLEADIGLVRPGQTAEFMVEAFPNRQFEALITQVRNAPRGMSGVVAYEAVLNVMNENLTLRPGMTASVDIIVDIVEDALLVPNGALRFIPPEGDDIEVPADTSDVRWGRVWVQDGEGAIAPRLLVIGATDGWVTHVVEGDLSEGQAVAMDIMRRQ